MKPITRIALVCFVAFCSFAARADVKLPAIFGDHMVLQRDATVPVWGWAEPGEDVSVTVAGQTKTTKAGTEGKWMVKFSKLKADVPATMAVGHE